LQISPEYRLLFSGGKDNNVRVWSLDTFECIKTLQTGSDITSLALRKNFLFAGLTSSIKVWDITTFKQTKNISSHHKGAVFSLLLTNRHLFSGSRDHYINAFHNETFDFEQQLHPPHYDGVDALCSLGDSFLYSGSRDKSIKLWNISADDIQQTKIIHTVHQDWVNSLCIHNNILFSACRDGMVGNWAVDSLNPLSATLTQAHPMSINSIISSPSNNILFTASNDRTVNLWKVLDPQELYNETIVP